MKFKLGRRPRLKGRKVRNLENGKWYATKREIKSAALRSASAKKRLDPELMMKCTRAGNTPEAIARREASRKKFFEKYPDFIPNSLKKAREAYDLYRYGRDGVRIIEVEWCEREDTSEGAGVEYV